MPRIFIAIRFDDNVKSKLEDIQNRLKHRGIRGNYCANENLHMTLAFIGEKYDLKSIRNAISEVSFLPFNITIDKLGTFPTKKGVIWCGGRGCEQLNNLARQVRKRLSNHGVTFRTLDFYPHISLVQHPSIIETNLEVDEFSILVERVYIMKSERIGGQLVYSEI